MQDSNRKTALAHLQQTDGDAEGNACAAKRTFVVCYGPWIALKGLEYAGQLELALLDGHEESGGAYGLEGHGLAWTGSGAGGGAETEHVLDLLWLILFSTPEDVGFAAF